MGPCAPPPWEWWPRSQGHSTGPETALCSTMVLRCTGLGPGAGQQVSRSLYTPVAHCFLPPLPRHTWSLLLCVLSLGVFLLLCLSLSLSLYFLPDSISVLLLASFHPGSQFLCLHCLRPMVSGHSLPSPEIVIPSSQVTGNCIHIQVLSQVVPEVCSMRLSWTRDG